MTQPKKRGRLIVLEGIDGAGKSTQIERLAKHLTEQGRAVFCTAEPTSLETGVALREALGGKVCKSECEMAAMFVADRIAHNIHPTEGIEAALQAGMDVLCDRYYYSTLAYQGQSTDYLWCKTMNLACPEIRRPDLCLYLDLTPQQSLERIRKGRTSVEIYENEETLTQVRQSFLAVLDDLKDEETIVRVDAYRSAEEIAEEIAACVDRL